MEKASYLKSVTRISGSRGVNLSVPNSVLQQIHTADGVVDSVYIGLFAFAVHWTEINAVPLATGSEGLVS